MTLEWHGDEVKERLTRGAVKGLYEASGEWLTRANRTCPHDTGHLERSGVNYADKENLEAVVGYGAQYAVEVHEAPPSVNFRGEGRRKWLEKSGRESAEDLEKHIAKRIREAMS